MESSLELIPYKKDSQAYRIAYDILALGREITPDDRTKLIDKHQCKRHYLANVLSKLRKAGLYNDALSRGEIASPFHKKQGSSPAPSTQGSSAPDTPGSTPPLPTMIPKTELDAFKRQLLSDVQEIIKASIAPPESNPTPQPATPPGNSGGSPDMPTSADIAVNVDPSMKQMGTWIYAKNLLWYDFARQGAFAGALTNFEGNWSDFINIVIEDYFTKLGVGIGMLQRKFA